MSYHLYYDHSCSGCNTDYIPYDHDVPCPSCGLVETERFANFIPEVAFAVYDIVDMMGGYMPYAWASMNLSDVIMVHLFMVLDKYHRRTDGWSFEMVAREYFLSDVDPDHTQFANYFYTLALRLFKYMENDPAARFPAVYS